MKYVKKGKPMLALQFRKHIRIIIPALIAALILISCAPGSGSGTEPPPPTLPGPSISVTDAPDARAAVGSFLDAWAADDYAGMYAMLTKTSRDAVSAEDFAKRYSEAMTTMALAGLDYEILSTLTNPYTAEAAFRVTYRTNLVGDLTREMVARLSLEDGEWRVQWEEALILPELKGGNRLAMDYKTPARGNIYARDGEAIAAQSDAVALGIVPGQIDNEEGLLVELFKLTGIRPDTLRASYEFAAPDWYIPVGEVSADEFNRRYNYYASLGGLAFSYYTSRFYPNGGIAPQAVGYTLFISPEELAAYQRQGYSGSERVGASGIEKWGEPYLAGKHGGSLYVLDPSGNIVTMLARSDPEPAQSITLTIDKDLQLQAQAAMGAFNGAIVVLERDTGRVLAMVSSPGFDPNLFDPNNRNFGALNDNDGLVNRAAQSTYPLGSVFKIITTSAAMDSGEFTPESTYDCQYEFTELLDRTLYDWTWDHCQKELQQDGECRTQPSGILTLPEGLMRSCNPWFWHIGLDLYTKNKTTEIANMARGFGLGQATGIQQVSESTGNIVDPTDGIQAVNQAIGQGDNTVTPLQVATFMAAVGNGGTLYRPQIVEKVEPVDGDPTLVFKPEARGVLPISQEILDVVRGAMREVVVNPRGTANFRLRGLAVPVYGKTGTAESGSGLPHAWFGGFTDCSGLGKDLPICQGKSDLAVIVLVENQGEGSDYAAPIFKRIMEIYFYGQPQSLYWWESSIGVTQTPTPFGGIPTRTPRP